VQALSHPYVAQFHDHEEPSCPHTIKISIDDNKKCGTTEYRYDVAHHTRTHTRTRTIVIMTECVLDCVHRNELYADIKKKKKEQKKATKKKREKKKVTKKRREKKEKD
jgi:hypothetical protein